MSYPEPIPDLSAEDWELFLKKLENFTLTEEQKEFYREAHIRFGGDVTTRT